MRVVKLEELLQQRAGTLYRRVHHKQMKGYTSLSVDDAVEVFVEKCGDNDFLFRDMMPCLMVHNNDETEAICEMVKNPDLHVELDPDDCIQRWGLYDRNAQFMIFERSDVMLLLKNLHAALHEGYR